MANGFFARSESSIKENLKTKQQSPASCCHSRGAQRCLLFVLVNVENTSTGKDSPPRETRNPTAFSNAALVLVATFVTLSFGNTFQNPATDGSLGCVSGNQIGISNIT
jgi:hypothetical protein